MKHTLKITLILVLIFFISQLVGLSIVNKYIDHKSTTTTGNVTWTALPYNIARPEVEQDTSFLYILFAVLIGTALVLLLIKFKVTSIWKIWFFFSVVVCLAIAFAAFINSILAFVIAIILAIFKVYKPNFYVHNFTELFLYGGLAAIFVPMLNLFSASILIILIAFYDMYAVWKSKHMIKMAKFQTESKVFAGFLVPYTLPKHEKIKGPVKKIKVKVKNAILGGGDVAFPLLFAGVILKNLVNSNQYVLNPALTYLRALIVPFFVSLALLWLFMKAEKDKFYPAMPFVAAGCFIGYGVLFLLKFLF